MGDTISYTTSNINFLGNASNSYQVVEVSTSVYLAVKVLIRNYLRLRFGWIQVYSEVLARFR